MPVNYRVSFVPNRPGELYSGERLVGRVGGVHSSCTSTSRSVRWVISLYVYNINYLLKLNVVKAVKCEVSNLVLLTSFLVETGEWWACDIVSYKRCSRPSHLHQWSDNHDPRSSKKVKVLEDE